MRSAITERPNGKYRSWCFSVPGSSSLRDGTVSGLGFSKAADGEALGDEAIYDVRQEVMEIR